MKTFCSVLVLVIFFGCKKHQEPQIIDIFAVDTIDPKNYVIVDSIIYYKRTVKGTMSCRSQNQKPLPDTRFISWYNQGSSGVVSAEFEDWGVHQIMHISFWRHDTLFTYSRKEGGQQLWGYGGTSNWQFAYSNVKMYLGDIPPKDSSKFILVSGLSTCH